MAKRAAKKGGIVDQDVAVPKQPDAPPAEGAEEAEMAPARDFTAERDAEVIPAAKELLARLAVREDLMMGSSQIVSADKAAKYYQELYQGTVVPLLLARNLKLDDIKYMFSIMLQPIQLLSDVTNESFRMNEDIANAKKWGVTDTGDLRVSDLDAALRDKPVERVENAGASA